MRRRTLVWLLSLGISVLVVLFVGFFWGPDLLIPLAESRASAALGRSVTIAHLHVMPGRFLRIAADDVVVGNPPNWHGEPLASIPRLTLEADLWALVRSRQLVVPLVTIERSVVVATQTMTGEANYDIQLPHRAKIGVLRIDEGRAHVRLAKLQVDLDVGIATSGDGQEAHLIIDANGAYRGEPISGHMVGGALLSLRDPTNPWPIDLRLQHGSGTTVSLVGTLSDPTALKGAALTLQLTGPDLSLLYKLLGLPLAKASGFQLSGQLDFANQRAWVRNLDGRFGNSDLAGTIEVANGAAQPEVHAELSSHTVNLADFGVGRGPGNGYDSTRSQPPPQRGEATKIEAGEKLVPTSPMTSPKLHLADVHLKYRGQTIQSGSVFFDNFDIVLDVVNGQVTLRPVSLGVGRGSIAGNVLLTPHDQAAELKGDIKLQRVDIARLTAAIPRFEVAGVISGSGSFQTTGSSLAQMVANANGGISLGMIGGDLSATMVHLSGLEFGKAFLAALGLPQRTPLECFIGDLPLRRGILKLKTLMLDTGEATVNGFGTIDLRQEKLNLEVRTEPKHFSIGSLHAPVYITGTLKHPNVSAGSEMAARGGLAAGLATVFPPLALLPTIQFGTGADHRCEALLARAKQQPGGQQLPPSHNQEPTP